MSQRMDRTDWSDLAAHSVHSLRTLLDHFERTETDAERMDAAYWIRLIAAGLLWEVAESVDYPTYLRSRWWKSVSMKAKVRAGHTCHLCRAEGRDIGGEAELHAHHAGYRSKGTDSELDDLVVLCARCHARHHGRGSA